MKNLHVLKLVDLRRFGGLPTSPKPLASCNTHEPFLRTEACCLILAFFFIFFFIHDKETVEELRGNDLNFRFWDKFHLQAPIRDPAAQLSRTCGMWCALAFVLSLSKYRGDAEPDQPLGVAV